MIRIHLSTSYLTQMAQNLTPLVMGDLKQDYGNKKPLRILQSVALSKKAIELT